MVQQGDMIGRFSLLDDLGRGGAGASVFLAKDSATGEEVALKTLRTDYVSDSMRARFDREVAVMDRLDHPRICRFVGAGEDAGYLYLAMEHVSGGTLLKKLKAGPLEVAEAARVGAEVADALAHAHGLEVVHRDLKPQNILFDRDGNPKIIDFGVAKAADTSLKTAPGSMLGSYLYAAPEQNEGKPADARSDLYALGIILWECLTGRPALGLSDLLTVIRTQISDGIPPPSTVVEGVPVQFDALLASVLRYNPDERVQSAARVRDQLRRLAG